MPPISRGRVELGFSWLASMRLLELTFGPGGVTLRQLAAGCEFGLVEDGVVFMSKQVYSLAKGGVGSAVGSTAASRGILG